MVQKKLISKKASKGPWYYEMIELGYNYRITDIQCALGNSQLKRLDSFNLKRRKIAKIYNFLLKIDCDVFKNTKSI